MRIGFVGLGKMGVQIVGKLQKAGHEVVATDIDHEAVKTCQQMGAIPAFSREELLQQLGSQPIVWLMIPSDFVQAEIEAYLELLPKGAIIIDGGNSDFQATMTRASLCEEHGVSLIDVGTSGGILGLTNGFSLMVGGKQDVAEQLNPLFDALTSPKGDHEYMGPSGYGHYVKMIHNGIEYGLMQAYAEGYDLLRNGPLTGINLERAAHVWQHGSIISSKLNDLVEKVLIENAELTGIEGYVAEGGEGRWTLRTAEGASIDMPALKAALDVRAQSQAGKVSFSTKLLAAMRNAFGGHALNKK